MTLLYCTQFNLDCCAIRSTIPVPIPLLPGVRCKYSTFVCCNTTGNNECQWRILLAIAIVLLNLEEGFKFEGIKLKAGTRM